MDRSFIRTPQTWARFDFFALLITIALLILFILMWLAGAGTNDNCCHSKEIVDTKPTPRPTSAPTAAPVISLSPYAIEFSHSNGYGKLNGLVANSATRTRVTSIIEEAFKAGEVQKGIQVEENVVALGSVSASNEAQGPFFESFERLSSAAANLQNGKLGIDPKNVRLSGTARNKEETAAIAHLLATTDLQGRQISTNIDVITATAEPEPEPTPIVINCEKVLQASSVEFASGSSVLTQSGKGSLDLAMTCLSDGTYALVGHTDNTGSAELNQKLSLARAKAAKTYLLSKGIDSTQLDPIGAGASSPIDTNDTAEGRANNRRLEFRQK